MSYSQEIYDAVRSRISGGDVGQAVRDIARDAFDISWAKSLAQEQIGIVGAEMTRPSVLFRPEISIDGDHYCALYGADLMAGCAGFGRTMHEAMADFDCNWFKQQCPAQAIEAGTAKTEGLGPQDESAVHAPKTPQGTDNGQ